MKKRYGVLFLALLAVLIFTGCSGINERRIQDFSLVESETDTEADGAKTLLQVVKDYFGKTLKAANDRTKRNRIHIVCSNEYASELGHEITLSNKNAFALFCQGTDLYLIAPSAEGISRAAVYLAKNYVDKDGILLLSDGDYYADDGARVKDAVYIGETPISEYSIVYSDKKLVPVCRELQYYVSQTGGGYLSISDTAPEFSICLELDRDLAQGERLIRIDDGQVVLTASDVETQYDNLHMFLDTYLGWIKTGTDQAHLSNTASVIRVPEQVTAASETWIEEREAIVTLWNVNKTRGFYLNTETSLKSSIMDYSEDQLYEYVKMLKFCGFTGVQVTDMCTVWAGVGGYDAAHERIRMLADAAHSLDMKFTLWVWGAEFSEFGWVDPEAVYTYADQGYSCARENPDVVATFEKYYDIYAQMADCCDRVIGHYYDPGNLDNSGDIAYFAKMLRDKFLSVNPEIDFGISCWVDAYDKNEFVRELGTDVTLYESGHHENEEEYNGFRTQISNFGVRLGTWAWNTCEMEIDQLAQMNFNMDIIRSVYQTARKYDAIAKPAYWSEMDSYHVINVFSLYCAGQMLIDPDVPSQTLYEGISMAAAGPEYAEDFAEMLSLIQDARSGHSWDTYWWSNDNYIVKSDDYPAQDILERCNTYIPVLQEMIRSEVESYTLPLPVSMRELLSMMLSHMKQIQGYAQFRLALDELWEAYDQGTESEQLSKRLWDISKPIPAYDCVIGAWGQIEARAQFEMITEFCQETGLDIPRHPELASMRKQFILGQLINNQKKRKDLYIAYAPYYQYGIAFGDAETEFLVEELVQEGLLTREENGGVYLSNWEDYTYYFLGQ